MTTGGGELDVSQPPSEAPLAVDSLAPTVGGEVVAPTETIPVRGEALVSLLHSHPELVSIATPWSWENKLIQARDERGFTTCLIRTASAESPGRTTCFRSDGATRVVRTSTRRDAAIVRETQAALARDDDSAVADWESASEDEDEVEEESVEPDADAPSVMGFAIESADGLRTEYEVDFDGERRLRIRTGTAALRSVSRTPSWMGETSTPPLVSATEDVEWQPLVVIAVPDWMASLGDLDIASIDNASSSGDVVGLVAKAGVEQTLCLRVDSVYRCVVLEARHATGITDEFGPIERLGPTRFVVRRATILEGGNGDGSGAAGTAELLVVDTEEDALEVVGTIPVGAMTWETEDFCNDGTTRNVPCFHRVVNRAFQPVEGRSDGCIVRSRAIGERVVTDVAFHAVRRAGRTATPRRGTGARQVHDLFELAFEGVSSVLADTMPLPAGGYRLVGARWVETRECR